MVVVSLFIPWWQLTIGDKLLQVNASPIDTNFGLVNTQFTLPIIWAWNMATILTFIAAGVVMLIYCYANKILCHRASGFLIQKTDIRVDWFRRGLSSHSGHS